MKPKSYPAAIGKVLIPEGFVRDRLQWRRNIDGISEIIDMQVSQIAGTTANLFMLDLNTFSILREAIGPEADKIPYQENIRISKLIDGNDRWWLRDPNGPEELSQIIKTYALPFMAEWRPLERQIQRLGRDDKEAWRHVPSRLYLAATLYRMGEKEEARRSLDNPHVSTRHFKTFMPMVGALRTWLDAHP